MLDLVQVEYAVVRARPADIVVAVGKRMATSNQCPMLKCIQDAIVQSLARYKWLVWIVGRQKRRAERPHEDGETAL